MPQSLCDLSDELWYLRDLYGMIQQQGPYCHDPFMEHELEKILRQHCAAKQISWQKIIGEKKE